MECSRLDQHFVQYLEKHWDELPNEIASPRGVLNKDDLSSCMDSVLDNQQISEHTYYTLITYYNYLLGKQQNLF